MTFRLRGKWEFGGKRIRSRKVEWAEVGEVWRRAGSIDKVS